MSLTKIDLPPQGAPRAFLSRSKIETFQACPRRGYYEYLYAGRGLRPQPGAVYFDTGSAVHAGLAHALGYIGGLYQGAVVHAPILEPSQNAIDHCVYAALQEFDRNQVGQRSEAFPERVWDMEIAYRSEQRDLVAALVYAWCVEEWIPFANRYEVLAVEQDLTFMASAPGLDGRAVELIYESRADALVREKLLPHSGAVISWKTAQDTSEWTRKRYRSDLQGFMECYFAGRTGMKIPSDSNSQCGCGDERCEVCFEDFTIDYNQVIYLVKGKKLRIGAGGEILKWGTPFDSVQSYRTDSFLLYPFVLPGGAPAPFFNELADVEPNVTWNNSYRKPGNISDSYFKGWDRNERFSLADIDDSGRPHLFNWIDNLKANRIFPTFEFSSDGVAPLNRVIVYDPPSARNDNLTVELIKEISFQQAAYASPGQQRGKDVTFPRVLKQCGDAPPDALGHAGCPYEKICKGAGASGEFGNEEHWTAQAPPTGFVWRTPHHEQELRSIGL